MNEMNYLAPLISRTDKEGSEGFILVAVLWMLGALAGLAAIYALYVHEAAFVFVGHSQRLQAQSLAMAGVELAVYQLTANPKAQPMRGRFAFALGNAEVAVEFRSENARIDLNFASPQLLAGLFAGLGASRDAADNYAARIFAWRTPRPQGTATDDEAGLYASAGRATGPRHAPFQHVNELGLVLGLPPVLIERALPFLTVYSGQGEVNLLDAAPQVLAALPGMSPDRFNVVLGLREGAPQDILAALLGMSAQFATVQAGKSNRVSVDVRFEGNRHSHAEAVILLRDDESEPYRILSWRDEDEEPMTDQLPNASAR
jgi:general secretion pathway protein K